MFARLRPTSPLSISLSISSHGFGDQCMEGQQAGAGDDGARGRTDGPRGVDKWGNPPHCDRASKRAEERGPEGPRQDDASGAARQGHRARDQVQGGRTEGLPPAGDSGEGPGRGGGVLREVQAPPAPRGPPELPGRQPERLGRPEEAENRKETSRSTQSVDPLPYEASEAESSTTPKRWVINHWRSDQLPIRPKGRAPPPPSQSSGHRGYREDRTTNKQTRRVAEEKDEERVTPAGFSPSQAVFRKDPATPGDLLSGQDEERFLEIMTADRKRQKEASVRSAARVAFFRSQTDTRLRRALIQRARVKHTAYHIGEMVCFSTGLRRARLSEEFGADQVCWSEARGLPTCGFPTVAVAIWLPRNTYDRPPRRS